MGLFGELFGFELFDAPAFAPGPAMREAISRNEREEYELLMKWGQVCRQYVEWHDRDGTLHIVRSGPHPTPEAATAEAFDTARERGWTPPLWWQWWRRGDTKAPATAAPPSD